jgi:replicative DNA helicase
MTNNPAARDGVPWDCCDLDAERLLLGAMLLDSGIVPDALDTVEGSDFHEPKHRRIFETIQGLHEAGAGVRLDSVAGALKRSGHLEAVGGYLYVAQLLEAVPCSSAWAEWGEIVRGHACKRRVLALMGTWKRRLAEAPDARQAVEELAASLRELAEAGGDSGDLPLWNLDDAAAYAAPAGEDIVGGGLLARGGLLLVVGPPGIGKSRLVKQLAMDLAAGTGSWLQGHFRLPSTPVRVLLLQLENGRRRVKVELERMVTCYSPAQQQAVRENYFEWAPETWRDRVLNLGAPASRASVARVLRRVSPEVVILDPWCNFSSAQNENDAAQVTEALGRIFGLLARNARPDVALILVHHARSGRAGLAAAAGWDAGAYARGSKSLTAAARAQLNLAPGTQTCGDVLVLGCGKINDGPRFARLGVRLDGATMRYSPDPDFDLEAWESELGAPMGARTPKASPEAVAQILHQAGGRLPNRPALIERVRQQLGVGRSRAQTVVTAAVHQGLVHIDANGDGAAVLPDLLSARKEDRPAGSQGELWE